MAFCIEAKAVKAFFKLTMFQVLSNYTILVKECVLCFIKRETMLFLIFDIVGVIPFEIYFTHKQYLLKIWQNSHIIHGLSPCIPLLPPVVFHHLDIMCYLPSPQISEGFRINENFSFLQRESVAVRPDEELLPNFAGKSLPGVHFLLQVGVGFIWRPVIQ